MAIRTEKLKTIILCTNREFKNFAVNNLNNAALPGEKITTDSIEEAHRHIETDGFCDNLLVDCSEYSKTELIEKLNQMFPLPKIKDELRRVITLVMLDPEEHMQLAKGLNQKFNDVFFFYMPMTQQQFIEAFHDGRKSRPRAVATNEAKKETKSQASSLNFIETTEHIRSCIESLNNISKDLSRIEDMNHVGQRFNGMIGAFAFYGKKQGYFELFTLATFIDNICRVYSGNEKKEVDKSHFDVVLNAAKNAFLFLKDLREGNPVSEDNIKTFSGIETAYKALEGISERSSQSQEEVDDLIDSLMSGS